MLLDPCKLGPLGLITVNWGEMFGLKAIGQLKALNIISEDDDYAQINKNNLEKITHCIYKYPESNLLSSPRY